MQLIADSGSTKCDWALVNGQETLLQTSTMGFNPYFHSEELITQKILESAALSQHRVEISEVYFYGAGCSSKDLNGIVTRALEKAFPAAKVVVSTRPT